jgi:hypothetical protein
VGRRGGNSLEAIDGGGQSCLSFSPTRGRAALLLYFMTSMGVIIQGHGWLMGSVSPQ